MISGSKIGWHWRILGYYLLMLWWILDCGIWFYFVRFFFYFSIESPPPQVGGKLIQVRVTNAVKVWTKRRKINNPYRGTLSSYGYVLLVIHFLSHVKQPAVVPFVSPISLFPVNYLSLPVSHTLVIFNDSQSLGRHHSKT